MGSPPPYIVKKEVPKFLSKSNIVIDAANTGIAKIIKSAVTKEAQLNIGNSAKVIDFWLTIVTTKLIAVAIDEIPFICKLIIRKSIELPTLFIESGG